MGEDVLQVRVAARQVVADGIVELELVSTCGRPLPAFTPGSHVDVYLPGGLLRQYSLCNNPAERNRYCIGVLKDPASRGGSEAVHRDLQVGRTLTISRPRNNFRLDADAADSLLLAGWRHWHYADSLYGARTQRCG